MIIYFSVQNFRSIRDKVTLDFRATPRKELAEHYIQEFPNLRLKLLKMAMIFGKNASGKTNILRAIEFLRSFVRNEAIDKDLPTGVQPFALDRDKNSEFEVKFVYENVVYLYQLILNQAYIEKEHLYYWPNGKKTCVFKRDRTDGKYSYLWPNAKASKTLTENLELTIPNQTVLASLKKFNYSGPIQQAYDWFRNTLAKIVYPDTTLVDWNQTYFLNEDCISEFKDFYVHQLQIADFNIQDISVNRKEEEIYKVPFPKVFNYMMKTKESEVPDKIPIDEIILRHHVSDGDYLLDIAEQSAGTIRFFEFCGFLCWLKQKDIILPIDEIERAMHEDLIKHFISAYLIYAEKSQIILTSHNSSILDMKDIIRRDTIWIADRLENGSTELTRLSNYQIKKEHSIGNLFRKGLLGGKPKIGFI